MRSRCALMRDLMPSRRMRLSSMRSIFTRFKEWVFLSLRNGQQFWFEWPETSLNLPDPRSVIRRVHFRRQ